MYGRGVQVHWEDGEREEDQILQVHARNSRAHTRRRAVCQPPVWTRFGIWSAQNTAVHEYRNREPPSLTLLTPRIFETSMQGLRSIISAPRPVRALVLPRSRRGGSAAIIRATTPGAVPSQQHGPDDPRHSSTGGLCAVVYQAACRGVAWISRSQQAWKTVTTSSHVSHVSLPTLAAGGSSFVEFDVSEHGQHYDRAYSILATLVVSAVPPSLSSLPPPISRREQYPREMGRQVITATMQYPILLQRQQGPAPPPRRQDRADVRWKARRQSWACYNIDTVASRRCPDPSPSSRRGAQTAASTRPPSPSSTSWGSTPPSVRDQGSWGISGSWGIRGSRGVRGSWGI